MATVLWIKRMVDTGEVENSGQQIKAFQAEGTVHADPRGLKMPGTALCWGVEMVCCD